MTRLTPTLAFGFRIDVVGASIVGFLPFVIVRALICVRKPMNREDAMAEKCKGKTYPMNSEALTAPGAVSGPRDWAKS